MKVIVAIDLSDCSKKALQTVLDRCWPKRSKFLVLSVFEPYDFMSAYTPALYTPDTFDAIAKAEHEQFVKQQSLVDDAVALLKDGLVEAEVTGVMRTGDICDKILEEAKAWNADLIICGTHGRHGISKLFSGSIAETIGNHAPCSVEIVKSKTTNAA
jgi:nucleotide-binding universal stress UspA family protein